MIVATAAPQLLVVLADTRADDVGRGKTALAVGARVGQNQRRLGLLGELIDPPEMSIEAVMAAMERVRAVVGFELDQRPVEHEPRAGDAVGVSADGRPEEATRGEI